MLKSEVLHTSGVGDSYESFALHTNVAGAAYERGCCCVREMRALRSLQFVTVLSSTTKVATRYRRNRQP